MAWEVVGSCFVETIDMGHFMNGGRGLSDAVAILVDQWQLPVHVAVCNVHTKCITYVV